MKLSKYRAFTLALLCSSDFLVVWYAHLNLVSPLTLSDCVHHLFFVVYLYCSLAVDSGSAPFSRLNCRDTPPSCSQTVPPWLISLIRPQADKPTTFKNLPRLESLRYSPLNQGLVPTLSHLLSFRRLAPICEIMNEDAFYHYQKLQTILTADGFFNFSLIGFVSRDFHG